MSLLNTNDLNVQEAVKAAVLQLITDEARERLIASAIDYLLKEQRGNYGTSQPSPLQNAVNSALASMAHDIAREEITSRPDVRDAVRKQLAAATEKILSDDWDASEVVAHALAQSLRGR